MEEERLYDLYALEEDIKRLQKLAQQKYDEKLLETLTYVDEEDEVYILTPFERDAIEHLIEAYRKVKEEELHWKGQYHLLSRKIAVIPESKVKEKIEEILEKGKQMSDKERQEETQFMQGKLKALEELLEEE